MPAAPTVGPANPKYKITAWLLNVRTGPGTNYPYAGLPKPYGTIVEVVRTEGTWALLTSNVWCSTTYLARVP